MLEVLLGTTGQLGELILRTGHDQILLRAGLSREAWRAVRIRGISTRLVERYGSDRPRATQSRSVGESASPSGERGGEQRWTRETSRPGTSQWHLSRPPVPRTVPAPAASRVGVVVPGD